jgi:hypothetical protein
LQGGHHVAQKFTTTTFPSSFFNSIVFPAEVLRLKFGAFPESCPQRTAGAIRRIANRVSERVMTGNDNLW